jgi:hypothetical protein
MDGILAAIPRACYSTYLGRHQFDDVIYVFLASCNKRREYKPSMDGTA